MRKVTESLSLHSAAAYRRILSEQGEASTFAPLIALTFLSWCLMGVAADSSQASDRGKAIFDAQCADCHGKTGQGVEGLYEKPLGGEADFDDVLETVVTTMPEEDPESCVGEQAEAVVNYIYERFYRPVSKQSQSGLMRLTVPQHRNALADLFATFAPQPKPVMDSVRELDARHPPSPSRKPIRDSQAPGLLGEYYQSRGMNKADRLVMRRIDTQLEFDFDTASPAPGITADQFAMIWEGSFFAPATGHYDFRITTENGARLYVNLDPQAALRKLRDDSSASGQRALIDAWVGSGKERQREARIFLLGGRRYPIRFEFFKYQEKSASVKLEWKTPHSTWEVLNGGATRISTAPRVYVCDTPFPPDDRSSGYERGTSVSPEWQSGVMNAAVSAARETAARLPNLADFAENDTNEQKASKLRRFIRELMQRGFRQPVSEEEAEPFIQAAFAGDASLENAASRAVVMILMSPTFLYPELETTGETSGDYAVATRLALAMWDSLPDEQLLQAAEDGKLQTAEQIQLQAERMLYDPRTRFKLRSFFEHWLEIEYRDLGKDKERFPDFDEHVIADLRHSLDLFIDQIVWGESSDYRELLLSETIPMNPRLQRIYGVDDRQENHQSDQTTGADEHREEFSSDEFRPVSFAGEPRSGILTHPYLLSAFAYHNNSSPIHRGVFLTRNIVGRTLNPPPVAIAFDNDEFDPGLTMREKVTHLTRDTACMSCHSIINPLGFSLEGFDAVGRWRVRDNDKPVDTRSEYTSISGETVELTDARDVAGFAVARRSAHEVFVRLVFQVVTKRDPTQYSPELLDRLTADFEKDDFHIRNLWANIASTVAGWKPSADQPVTRQVSSIQR